MLKKRPLLITPFSLWVKPGLKIRFFLEHGADEAGRMQLQIVDELDREYWVRLKPFQYALFRFFQP